MKNLKKIGLIILSMLIITGCGEVAKNTTDDAGVNTTSLYPSAGTWPEKAGSWQSINEAAGSKYATWAYLKIKIGTDGLFSGTYQNYAYSSTWDMPTAWGNIPIPVYNPAGTTKKCNGALDFGKLSGKMFFEGIGETTASVNIFSNTQIALSFPTGFKYTVANFQR